VFYAAVRGITCQPTGGDRILRGMPERMCFFFLAEDENAGKVNQSSTD